MKTGNLHFNQDQLKALSIMLCNVSDDLMVKLGLNLRKDSRKYSGCCPVHSGDNVSALNVYYVGYSLPGYWVCRTKHCEKEFNSTIIGFIRGVLSNQKGWSSKSDQKISFSECLQWCLDFLGKKPEDIKVDKNDIEKYKFMSLANTIDLKKEEIKNTWTIKEFESAIDQSNVKYFLDKGYSQEIIKKYKIGMSKKQDKEHPSYNRIIVPFLDETGKYVIGAQGRSVFDKCGMCDLYHDPSVYCPTKILGHSKWSNIPEGFQISQTFFNYWNAKNEIKKKGDVIIVEGPPDVLRLEDAGIHNSIAICGSNMTDSQQILLEQLCIYNIYLLMDNDEAGINCKMSIYDKMKRQCNIKDLLLPSGFKDIGEIRNLEKVREICLGENYVG